MPSPTSDSNGDNPTPSTENSVDGSITAEEPGGIVNDNDFPDPRLDPDSDMYDPTFNQPSTEKLPPSKHNWLTDKIMELLDQHQPSEMISANPNAKNKEMKAAFKSSIWRFYVG